LQSAGTPAFARMNKLLQFGAAILLCALIVLGAHGWLRSASRPELTIATVNNADMVLLQQLSKEFEQQHAVKLNWVVLGENVLRQRLTIDIATGGSTFDVITIGSYEAPIWAERGWLKPVDDLNPSYDYNDIFDVVRDGLSYQGRLYALPFYAESSFTYYRSDLFQKAGLQMPLQPSYDDIRKFANELNDPQHGVYGICLRGEPGWGENVALISTMVQTFGGRWTDMKWQPQLTTPAWEEAVSFYVDLIRDDGPPGAVGDGYNENRALFANGNCAMWIDSTSAAGYFLDPSQSRVARTTGFAKAPIAKVPNGAAWIWAWGLAIPSTSSNVDLARQFIQWATSKGYINLVGQRLGWLLVPPGSRKSTYEIPHYVAVAPFAPLVSDAIAHADYRHPSSLPVPYVGIQYMAIPEFQAIGTEVGQQLSAALAGRTSVKQSLAESQAEAARLLKMRTVR
jgi:sorbitol/mannitol transport system substrate-binding protein